MTSTLSISTGTYNHSFIHHVETTLEAPSAIDSSVSRTGSLLGCSLALLDSVSRGLVVTIPESVVETSGGGELLLNVKLGNLLVL